jgi:exopolysaccharide biosynthesis protein
LIPLLLGAIEILIGAGWNPISPGLWLREERIASSGPLAAVRAVIVRIDPAVHRFRLDIAQSHYGLEAEWTLDSMPADAVVAVNAGQFTGGFPWGWVVRDGVEWKPRGAGSLAMSFVVDSAGFLSLLTSEEAVSSRHKPLVAFQSYPALLIDGQLPLEIRKRGRGVDIDHHDSRVAICTTREGHAMIILTRLAVPGRVGETLPWGPTVPEMARYVRSLGCVRAMLLDGGISSQMAVRMKGGQLRRWTNWRRVPMAIVVIPLRSYGSIELSRAACTVLR